MRRISTVWSCTLALVASLAACKYNKETVPVSRDVTPVRVPNQQRIVALAVDEAVEALDFSPLTGKAVALELTGIFPHSDTEMMAYVIGQVEAKLARAGVRVLHPVPTILLPGQVIATTTKGPVAGPAPGQPPAVVGVPPPEPPDFRVQIGVSWGGIDVRDKERTDEPLLIKQIGMLAGTVLGGLTLMTVMDGSNAKIMGFTAIIGGPIGAFIWFKKRNPFPHVYTLYGRVRLVVNSIAVKDGRAFTTEGRGQSKVVVDETNPEGYRLVE